MAISADKSIAIQQLIGDLMEFSCASMRWCSVASEQATRQIATILEHLTDEAKRVASMSNESLAAVDAIRMKLGTPTEGKLTPALVAGLKDLQVERHDALAFVDPIIQTLQYQDRVTQAMDAIVRMFACWSTEREKIATGAAPLDLTAFGRALFACTTTPAERDQIRACIPDLPSEAKAENVTLF